MLREATGTIEVPDGIEPIVGYRAWLCHGGYPPLKSLSRWKPRAGALGLWLAGQRAEACCHVYPVWHSPPAPQPYCLCGIHAFSTIEYLAAEFREWRWPYALVFGTVALWGTVICHERGYRAQYARITGIERRSIFAESLAKQYGVPILDFGEDLDFYSKARSQSGVSLGMTSSPES